MDSHVHTIAILPPQDVKPTAKAEVTRIPSIHCTLLVAHHTTLANPSPPPSPASGEGYEDGDGEDGGGGEGGGGVGGESGGDNDRLVEAGPEMEFKSAQAAKVAKAANRPVTASRRAQVTAQLPQTEVGGAEPPDQGLSSEMPGVDFTWNRETLEVHEIFHDQLGTLVSEVFVMQDMEAVEKVLENVRDHYIVQKRLLTLPMLFLFNKVDEMIGGLHYSAMVAGADGKGVRFFEPSRGGIRERNLPMAKRVRQFLAGNSTELNLGIVHDALPDQWDNHCPPQADGSEQEGMRCGHTLRGALLRCCGAAEVARIGKTKGDGGGGGPHQGPADPLATAAATTAAVGGDDRKRRRPAAKEAKGPTSGPPPLKKATVDSLSSSVSHRWSEPPSSSCTQTPLSAAKVHKPADPQGLPLRWTSAPPPAAPAASAAVRATAAAAAAAVEPLEGSGVETEPDDEGFPHPAKAAEEANAAKEAKEAKEATPAARVVKPSWRTYPHLPTYLPTNLPSYLPTYLPTDQPTYLPTYPRPHPHPHPQSDDVW